MMRNSAAGSVVSAGAVSTFCPHGQHRARPEGPRLRRAQVRSGVQIGKVVHLAQAMEKLELREDDVMSLAPSETSISTTGSRQGSIEASFVSNQSEDDAWEAPATLTPRVAAGLAPSDPGERLLKSLHNFGQSKFEKTVLLQIASQLHTSQVGRIGDVFAAADLARSGLLDKTDFVTVLRGLGASPEDAESYVSCLDVNENGQVEYTDFVAGCIGLLLESLRGLLWQSFCVIDVDGNGVLGREEVHAVVTHAELHKYGFPCDGDRSVGEALDGMDIDKNGQISFDELCRHFLPQRPDLPSPVLSPKTPRDRSGCRSGVAASAGYEISSGFQASSGALGGAREKISHVPTLRDEDFAQLLDEIEADHDDLSVPNNSSLLGSGAGGMDTLQREASVSSLLTFNAPSSNLDGYGINPLEEPLHLEDSAGILLGAIEAPTPPPPTAADVDEELSRMLADIANGP